MSRLTRLLGVECCWSIVLLSVLLLLLDESSSVSAWGPKQLEPAGMRSWGRSSFLRMTAKNGDSGHDDEEGYMGNDDASTVNMYREQLERSFWNDFDFHLPLSEISFARSDTVSFITTNYEEEILLDDEDDDGSVEECEIPEDFKILASDQTAQDVMDFLGIRKAKPLEVLREWE